MWLFYFSIFGWWHKSEHYKKEKKNHKAVEQVEKISSSSFQELQHYCQLSSERRIPSTSTVMSIDSGKILLEAESYVTTW